MKKDDIYAVILAGGRGERFWPLSTAKNPKQLLSLVGEKTMVAESVERLDPLIPKDHIFILTNRDLVEATQKAIPSFPEENIIGEPVRRDTAAAVTLGCALVKNKNPNAVFCVMTADHVIGREDIFRKNIEDAVNTAAADDVLITLGIQPLFPSTGFGYIEAGEQLASDKNTKFYKAKRFVEKPDRPTAENYMKAGSFYWNSGMFVWSVKTFESAMSRHMPHLVEMMNNVMTAVGSDNFIETLKKEFDKIEKISIDYALMEKADNIVMAVGEFEWDDVGSWVALENHFASDEEGNIKIGNCESIDSRGNIVMSDGDLVAMIGVDNLVVVKAHNALLICPKGRAQDVKKMVHHLALKNGYKDLL